MRITVIALYPAICALFATCLLPGGSAQRVPAGYQGGLEERLKRAIVNSDIAAVDRTLESGADVLAPYYGGGGNALHLASLLGDNEALHELLKSTGGSGVNAIDVMGWSPLHWAAVSGHVEALEMLCAWGATTRRSRVGMTPLHLACLRGDGEAIANLSRIGSSPWSERDDGGRVPGDYLMPRWGDRLAGLVGWGEVTYGRVADVPALVADGSPQSKVVAALFDLKWTPEDPWSFACCVWDDGLVLLSWRVCRGAGATGPRYYVGAVPVERVNQLYTQLMGNRLAEESWRYGGGETSRDVFVGAKDGVVRLTLGWQLFARHFEAMEAEEEVLFLRRVTQFHVASRLVAHCGPSDLYPASVYSELLESRGVDLRALHLFKTSMVRLARKAK